MTAQQAYELDRQSRPLYHDGKPRPPFHRLSAIARWSWEKSSAPSTP